MFNFRGMRAFYTIAMIVLIMQMLKLVHFVDSVEAASFVAIFMTIGLIIKLTVFDKKLKDLKSWLMIFLMLVQEVALGLDQMLSAILYDIVIVSLLICSICFIYSMDAPSIRKQMDDNAYVLKITCAILTQTLAIAVADILLRFIFPPYLPM